jgi:hypothetical protein
VKKDFLSEDLKLWKELRKDTYSIFRRRIAMRNCDLKVGKKHRRVARKSNESIRGDN